MWDFLLSSIWGWLSISTIVVLICVVVGYFFPGFRVLALEVAGGVLAAAAIYAKGNRDEAKKWDKQIDKDVKKGEQARTDADAAVDSGRVRGDEWDRDKGGV